MHIRKKINRFKRFTQNFALFNLNLVQASKRIQEKVKHFNAVWLRNRWIRTGFGLTKLILILEFFIYISAESCL